MKSLLMSLSLLVWSFSASTSAAPPDNADALTTHLEFLGYEVTQTDERLKAVHSKYLNLLIKKYRGGMLATSFFGGTDQGKSDRGGFLALVNSLNMKAAAARYYIDNDGDLAIEAYYPGEYNKRSFSAFLDAFNLESTHLSQVFESISKYIE